MRIRNITVNELFNFLNHSVDFNLNDHITIIHGANGLGKTTLLKLIHIFFDDDFSSLNKILFSSFNIEFDDKSKLTVQKTEKKSKRANTDIKVDQLSFTYEQINENPKEYVLDVGDSLTIKTRLRQIELENFVPGLVPTSGGHWFYVPTEEILSSHEVIARFSENLPYSYQNIFKGKEIPPWLTKIKQSINVYFIQTQRLFSYTKALSRLSSTQKEGFIPAVKIYSDELKETIKNTLAEYAELTQSLDRSFPERLLEEGNELKLSSDELRDRLSALENKQQALESIGLLEEEQRVRFEMPKDIDPVTEKVLSVYVADVESKLQVFDSIAAKIDLLRKIIDRRFFYKKITMNRDKGFVFTNIKGLPLSTTQLSSGEQNELVLIYELLFKVKPGSLILIDEPEISFHIAWQQHFLKDLEQIIKISRFDVLIATHSPQIIHDRWDLTVELQGPEEI